MSEGIVFELQFFFQAFLWGILMMILYDGLRLFRRLVSHSVLAVAIEDILYWIVCGLLIFRMLYLENSGAIRGFAILAVVLGMLLYLQFEKFLRKIRKKLQNSVRALIMKLRS